MAKTIFFIFFLCLEYEKISFLCFLLVYISFMIYCVIGGLKFAAKSHTN